MLKPPAEKTPFDDLRVTLLLARMSHEGWRLFDGPHAERHAIVAVRDEYRHFFTTVEEALFTTFIIKLSCVFGTRRDEISLRRLPAVVKESEFDDLADRGARLHKYRSKAIAHRARGVTERDFAKETGFTYNDLKRLLDDTCALFDRIAAKQGLRGILNVSCGDDFMQLIHDLALSKPI